MQKKDFFSRIEDIESLWNEKSFNKSIDAIFILIKILETSGSYYHFDKILKLIEKYENSSSSPEMSNIIIGKLFFLKGRVNRKLNNPDDSLISYEKALSLFKSENMYFLMARTETCISSVYYDISAHREAIDRNNRALLISKNLNNAEKLEIEASAFTNIGSCNEAMWKLQEARTELLKASAIREKLNQMDKVAKIQRNLGCIQLDLNDMRGAELYFRKALDIYETMNDESGRIGTLQSISISYYKLGHYQQALQTMNEVLSFYVQGRNKRSEMLTKKYIITIKLALKQYEEVLKLCYEVLEYFNEKKSMNRVAEILNDISRVYSSQNDHTLAIEYYFCSYKLFKRINNLGMAAIVLSNIGKCYYDLDDYEKAIKYLTRSYTLQERNIDKIPYTQDRIKARKSQIFNLDLLAMIFIKLKDFKGALYHLELRKSRELLTITNYKPSKDSIDKNLIDQVNNLFLQLENTTLDEDENRKEIIQAIFELENQIRDISNTYKIKKPKGDLIESIISILPEHSWIILEIFYFFPEQFLGFFFLESNDSEIKFFSHTLQLNEYQEILKNNKKFVKYSSDFMDEELEALLKKMSLLYFDKLFPNDLKKILKDKSEKTVFIVPFEGFHQIPYEILYDGSEFFGLKYNIVRNFNLSMINQVFQYEKPATENTAFLIAPSSDLLEANSEIEAIEAKLSNLGGKILKSVDSDNAKEDFLETVNNQNINILHFAGHGVFSIDQPTRSYLEIGSEKLYANEIPVKMNLKSQNLVVLNACETGLYNITFGDEPRGLVRSLFQAGAKSIILTGWSIFDDSSKDFMIEFYSNYTNKVNLSNSVRIARRKLKENVENNKYDDNFDYLHWGAFRLFGNPFLIFE